jgi:hypothetical protein
VVKADLLPALSVLLALTVFSFPIGFLWSRIAPPERVRMRYASEPRRVRAGIAFDLRA